MQESETQQAAHNRRILFVQYTNPAGYPPLAHVARILADRQWELAFFGAHPGGSGELRFPPHPRMVVRMMGHASPGWRQKLHYCAYLVRVVAFALSWRPAWIYASDPLACIPALVLSRILRLRVAYHEHDSPSGDAPSAFWRLVLRARNALARRAFACVLPNAERAKEFADETGANPETIFCVWNCPSKSECVDGEARPQQDRFWLHYHGSVNRERLPLEVIDSLSLLPDRVGLRVVGYETLGSVGYLAELVRRADAGGVATSRVELCGLRQRDEMLALARSSHLGLALMPRNSIDPNMQRMTGASNKAFEYLACGLPVLVSALQEWEEMFVRPGYGLACDPARAEDIARAVRWFLEHPAERLAMGSAGRARVHDDWNYESQFAPVLAVLERGAAP